MKKIYSYLLIFACISVGFSSCINDLDTEPLTDSTLTPEKAWEDPDSYEQFLAKIYAGLTLSGNEGPSGLPDMNADDQGEATFLRSYWNLQQLGTDEVIGAWDNETLRGLQFCQWTSSNNFIALNYTRIYLNIAYANEYLRETTDEKLNSRNVSSDLKTKIAGFRAEARALRAMNYYFLMDLYANIPFIDEDFAVGANGNVEQKDRKFFFTWIESELKDIEGKLPAADKAHYGMVNDPTAWMILAKIYLNAEVYIGEQKYDECLTYLNKILNAGFTLDPTYKNMFGADNEKSPEIIFSLVYDGNRATTYGGTTFLLAASYKSDMNPGINFGFTQSWSGIRAKESFSSLFSGDDKRALFWKEGRTQETTQWYDFSYGWSVIKYTNMNSDGTAGSNSLFADTDFPVYRLADAYLMYAEAVLRGGQGGTKEKALELIKELRDRAGIPTISNSELTLDFILDERSRELYWEGHRRTDLIRFNKFTKNYNWPWKNGIYNGVANIDDKYKIYPIPSTELSANLSLKQNPGY
ncbi:RagB/SusD family nutrient uptake outer membrane protein [Dysgonomonas macrotermitis]|uniref:Starch-binding associating with outer membrane n=1 Tax=Dysgonomonas macrotermitis TaxID=1346286 RepID=A0A1M4SFI9_9BACT|nr:RagB/SusD family nutrient uptake outer membrane protein [Dysgonomonas macrotermitis]SHE30966.1 Starch-binding associating with outer membrane [Dysgonomonas macrotermitis]